MKIMRCGTQTDPRNGDAEHKLRGFQDSILARIRERK
jgi:hypothetical protein